MFIGRSQQIISEPKEKHEEKRVPLPYFHVFWCCVGPGPV
jgi:hypothetical protein